ncbi:OmpH family outer membrane protein [Erythrobacter sp. SCSIO 43205]|uniref:OmpH family outer membrane protein n=1 Tax=Erythrobacter sp. SCSIO 43205 TaxID=2779361 RepID=UPI001CAA353D|nr:OmpH family outer membrane protein [Erythrobacter sp. SCSIO 43205]UAB76832.1 OmpH family outer membrane protein [Erythrobacter sp. SCSIO 43205]
MKLFKKTLSAAALAAGALVAATPAAAQVQGQMATADISRAILGTTALQTAYNQVGTTYAAQIEQRSTKQQQLTQLLQPFDSNGDGQLAESELAGVQSSPNFTQIQTLEQEIANLNAQVNAARVYAVEQVFAQYPAALTEVAEAQNIAIVFQPDMLQYAKQGTDITSLITTSLNAKVPSVQIVPPANYRPNQNAAQIFQEIQQTLLRAQIIQQQQAAQQGQQQSAPAGR